MNFSIFITYHSVSGQDKCEVQQVQQACTYLDYTSRPNLPNTNDQEGFNLNISKDNLHNIPEDDVGEEALMPLPRQSQTVIKDPLTQHIKR